MVFSSVTFIFAFLPLSLAGYYLIRNIKWKNVWLLWVSLLFYAWGGLSFLPIMIVSILINYVGGMGLFMCDERFPEKLNLRKWILLINILLNLLLLGYWKYFNFSITILNDILNTSINVPTIALPIGISFFTFQGLSYVIDAYRRDVSVQKNPLNIALYISMFPQLIAGPIVRYADVNQQIEHRTFSSALFASGIRRFSMGLFKKAVFANTFAATADVIFSIDPAHNRVATAWLGILTYMLQLYFDFSGYSDMAIGLGRMLGFHFLENFNYPFISKSVSEYWRRWHISLGTWFREYVYIPLGGNRCSKPRVLFNIFFVWMLTGLWHGAAWTYVIWGISLGLIMIFERQTGFTKKLGLFGHVYVMLYIFLAHVIFRAESLTYGWHYILSLFGLLHQTEVGFEVSYYINRYLLFMLFVGILGTTPVYRKALTKVMSSLSNETAALCTNLIALCMFAISIIYVTTSTYNPFIYFRF